MFLLATGRQFDVDELPAVVGIQSQQGKRQQLSDMFERRNDRLLSAVQERQALGPARGDIGEGQCRQEGTFH
jgi:hypothetical protein